MWSYHERIAMTYCAKTLQEIYLNKFKYIKIHIASSETD